MLAGKRRPKPKHLTSLSRFDSACRMAVSKFQERFELSPAPEIMDEICHKIRKEHRLSPHMGARSLNARRGIFENQCKYHHWKAGKNKRGHTVQFCWSNGRNEAGYFLFWQQTDKKGLILSTRRWGARKGKRQAKEISRQRMLKWRERHGKTT